MVADALDPRAVAQAVAEAEPEVIVHQLTALTGKLDIRKIEASFDLTNRLRSEGTDHLLAAGRAIGTRRFVAQSFAGWQFARIGGPVKTETDPLDTDPPPQMRTTLAAIRHLEDAVTGADGIVLRYGGFYGPGTSMGVDPDGEQVAALRARKLPIVGDGGGVWSFVHVADAARRRRWPSSAARQASTTSSTTPPRRFASGPQRRRERSVQSRRDASRSGSAGSPRARRRP